MLSVSSLCGLAICSLHSPLPLLGNKAPSEAFHLIVYLLICSKPCRMSWERLSQNYSWQPAWLPPVVQQLRISTIGCSAEPMGYNFLQHTFLLLKKDQWLAILSQITEHWVQGWFSSYKKLHPSESSWQRNTSFVALHMLRQGIYQDWFHKLLFPDPNFPLDPSSWKKKMPTCHFSPVWSHRWP